MEPKLSVQIGADLSELSKKMAQAPKIVSQGIAQIDKSTISLRKNFDSLNRMPFTFGANFKRQTDRIIPELNKLDNAVKKSRSNLQAWVYIIQDAPFGLMGIQNNLTQLIPGVGAASLAFSALISALTFSQVGMTYWNRGAKDTTEATKTLKDEVDAYIETLSGVESANLKAAQSYDKDVSALERLYKASQDTTLSLSERKKAVDLLQAEYPSYFKNISDETILNGGAKSSYDKLTASIIAKAKAQAYADEIAEGSKELRNSEKLVTSLDEEIKALRKKEAAVKAAEASAGANIGQGSVFYARQLEEIQTQITEKEAKYYDIKAKGIPIAGNIMLLEKEISKLIGEQGVEVLGLDSKLGDVEDKYNRINTSALDINKTLKEENAEREKGLKLITGYLNKLSGADGTNAKNLSATISLPSLDSPDSVNIPIVSELDLAIMRIGEQADTLKNDIAPLLTDAFYSLGEAINSGDFSNFGEGILRAMSGFIADLGQMFIKEGLMQIAAGIAKNVAFPGSGINNIASGKLLIAAGAIGSLGAGLIGSTSMGRSSQGYQIPKFADGGIVSGPTMGIMGEYPGAKSNPEVIAPLSKLKSMIGGGTSTIIPDVRISGQDLVVVFDRANKSRNRVT